MIFGHVSQRNEIEKFLAGENQTLLLSGPKHVGKFTVLAEVLKKRNQDDVLVLDDSMDSLRSVRSFSFSNPLVDEYRLIIIDNIDEFNEAVQDAMLKMCEEPHDKLKIIAVTHDFRNIRPALLSRMHTVVEFRSLSRGDMTKFADDVSCVTPKVIFEVCDGYPGLYKTMLQNSGFEDLYNTIDKILGGCEEPVFNIIPDVISSKQNRDGIEAIVHMCRYLAHKHLYNSRSLKVLEFASVIYNNKSVNVEMHYSRFVVECTIST